MPGQRRLPQCDQDKRANRGQQEKEGRTGPHYHQQDCSGAGREFQVPWWQYHQQTIMVQTYQDSHEECKTTPFPPQET